MNKKVAFPGLKDSGMDGVIAGHFGKTEAFIVVDYNTQTKEINEVQTINNPPHGSGGCMMPVNILKEQNVDDVVLGGIGGRPLMGFVQVGIKPFHGIQGTIQENYEAFCQNKLNEMVKSSCNGGPSTH